MDERARRVYGGDLEALGGEEVPPLGGRSLLAGAKRSHHLHVDVVHDGRHADGVAIRQRTFSNEQRGALFADRLADVFENLDHLGVLPVVENVLHKVHVAVARFGDRGAVEEGAAHERDALHIASPLCFGVADDLGAIEEDAGGVGVRAEQLEKKCPWDPPMSTKRSNLPQGPSSTIACPRGPRAPYRASKLLL